MKNKYYEIEMKIANNTYEDDHGYELDKQIMAQLFLVRDYAIDTGDFDMLEYFSSLTDKIVRRGIVWRL